MPRVIISDSSTEFTSMEILRWSQDRKIDCHSVAPDKPARNGFIERFNARLRTE